MKHLISSNDTSDVQDYIRDNPDWRDKQAARAAVSPGWVPEFLRDAAPATGNEAYLDAVDAGDLPPRRSP